MPFYCGRPSSALLLSGGLHIPLSRFIAWSTLCPMAADFAAVFAALKPVLGKHAERLAVKADTPTEYTLVTRCASPFPQHKGQPLYFGSVLWQGVRELSSGADLYVSGAPEERFARVEEAHARQGVLQLQDGTGPELIADLARLAEAESSCGAKEVGLNRAKAAMFRKALRTQSIRDRTRH